MATKRKHVVVTIEKRMEALSKIDKGESLKNIAAEFGVGTSTVSDWKKNRNRIEDFCFKMISKDSLDNRCKAKKAKLETLDDALFVWFCAERERGLPISGPVIQQKALSLNQKLPNGDPSFTASQGWLDRWKKRHGVRQLTITGESLSGDVRGAEQFRKEFDDFIKKEQLTADQVYNADETGLFYRMLPSKTLASKMDDSAKGYKKGKDRLTIMACSNASGKHKLPLLLIGKSKNPRCFKNIKQNSLPVVYTNQKSSWMVSVIFKNWFYENFVPEVEKYLKKCGLPIKAVLLIDNAPSHPPIEELAKGNITVKFLPPNVTSLIQPMDQGVLEKIKKVYKKQMLSELVEDEGVHGVMAVLKSFNVKTVVYMIAEAWNQVERATLIKSWKKLWPGVCDLPENKMEEEEEENASVEQTDDFLDIFKNIDGCSDVDAENISDWLEMDNDGGYKTITDEEIIASCSSTTVNENDSDSDSVDEPATVMSHSEAVASVDQLINYFESQHETSPNELLMLKRMRDRTARKRSSKLKQQKLTTFFTTGIERN